MQEELPLPAKTEEQGPDLPPAWNRPPSSKKDKIWNNVVFKAPAIRQQRAVFPKRWGVGGREQVIISLPLFPALRMLLGDGTGKRYTRRVQGAPWGEKIELRSQGEDLQQDHVLQMGELSRERTWERAESAPSIQQSIGQCTHVRKGPPG